MSKEMVREELQGALKIMEKNIADAVFNRINELQVDGQLKIPPNYAVGNNLKLAYLKLKDVKDRNGKPALEVCSPHSIANALLEMVMQGLSVAKDQCYFIVYGNELTLMRSYFGDQTVIKNIFPNDDVNIFATCIYEGDEVQIEIDAITGKERVVSHKTQLKNRNNKIEGAYATLVINGKQVEQELMSWEEIQVSWSKSKSRNTQKEYPQEMAKRTVIRRLAKRYINTSNDVNLFVVASYNRTTPTEYNNDDDFVTNQEELHEQVDVKANTEELIIEGEVVEQPVTEEAPQTLFHEEDLPPFA